jgi:N-acetylglucosaminyl-diphospho-decaprenol L-rhamnosyltransferase
LKLLIGIVTYNSQGTVKSCLDSISNLNRGEIELQITIHDNTSTDSTLSFIRDNFPHVHILDCPQNKGYAYGVNRIAESSDWDYFLILNPDIQIKNLDFLKTVEEMNRKSEIGLIGAKLVNSNDEPVHSFGDLPSPQMLRYDFSGFRSMFPHPNWSSFRKVNNETERFEVGYVTGAFMMISRVWWDKVGNFDESFFLYFEDTDWAYRLHKAGGKAIVDPDTVCVHESGASFGSGEKVDEYKLTCFFESAYKYLTKHFGKEDSDRTFSFIRNRAMLKLNILALMGRRNSDAYLRQELVIRIHKAIEQSGHC